MIQISRHFPSHSHRRQAGCQAMNPVAIETRLIADAANFVDTWIRPDIDVLIRLDMDVLIGPDIYIVIRPDINVIINSDINILIE